MATGIPKTRWKNGKNLSTPERAEDALLSLSYKNKRNEKSILATPPLELVRVWPEEATAEIPNRLYYGGNLSILAGLLRDPQVRGKARLVYIDPPYATSSIFQSRNQTDAYADLLSGAGYVEFMRERLILLRELLADDGSIYVHLDENMAFHIKVVMDEVFGRDNFRNWITRKKCNPKNYTRKTYGNISDFILFYTKSGDYVWHRPVEGWTPERAAKEYQYIEEKTGRRYKKVPIHAPGERNGDTGKMWRGMMPPPGKHWQYTRATLDEMDARGEIYWSPNGNPRRKVYLDESDGVPVQDIWLEFRDAHNQNIEITGYPTEKNSDLLARIIEASSNPGDVVLDCFCGSGTSLSVASKLGRSWIGIDNSPEAIATTLRRFAIGAQPMGDFVSSRNGDSNKTVTNTTLSLFDFPEPVSSDSTPSKSHTPVTDFALFCEEAAIGDLSVAIKEWKKNAGQASTIKEQPATYSHSKKQASTRKHKSKTRR